MSEPIIGSTGTVTDTKQQANFVHKMPKRMGMQAMVDCESLFLDDLSSKGTKDKPKGDIGSEHVASRAPGFRALPLNRKFFEAPSLLHQKRSTPQLPEFQEFHLNVAAVPSTSACGNNAKVKIGEMVSQWS